MRGPLRSPRPAMETTQGAVLRLGAGGPGGWGPAESLETQGGAGRRAELEAGTEACRAECGPRCRDLSRLEPSDSGPTRENHTCSPDQPRGRPFQWALRPPSLPSLPASLASSAPLPPWQEYTPTPINTIV